MKSLIHFFAWTVKVLSSIAFLLLWVGAIGFISDRIGMFFAILLALVTNIVGPVLCIIWNIFSGEFNWNYLYATIIVYVSHYISNLLIAYVKMKRA